MISDRKNKTQAVLIVSAVMALAACGPTVTSTPTIAPTTTTGPSSTTTSSTSTTQPIIEFGPEAEVASTLVIGDWEGEIIDFGPLPGDLLAVAGVSFDDLLNVRSGPGVQNGIVTTLAPHAVLVHALGMSWALPDSIWYAIDADGVQGWVHSAFLAFERPRVNFTPTVLAELGVLPKAASVTELGAIVADALASTEPASAIEQSGPETLEEGFSQVVFDVLGLGDDSVYGYRLFVSGIETGGEWTLIRVDATIFCLRGVDGDRCV